MLPTINIGPFVFPTAGLVYIFGVWACLNLIDWSARRLDLEPETTYALGATGVLAGFIGARLTFVALHWPAFQENLLGIVWPLTTGYNAWGGVVVGLAAAFFYGRARQLPPAATLDALAPGLVAGLIVISLADLLAGPGFGTLTLLPWGIEQFGLYRHPVQIYEIIVGIVALLVWWWLAGRRAFAGQLFLATTAVYSAGRLFVDAFRANTWITNDGWHVLQIISLAALLASLLLLARPINQST
ncbi:MAG TPA: prolipoprotein diacylglyceryl transferase family protein [Anaerolineae bacterium]